jgi:hypothetical protein
MHDDDDLLRAWKWGELVVTGCDADADLAAPDWAIPPENRIPITFHLPICRDCNELCMTMYCTREEYDAWWVTHDGHNIEHGPEVPVSLSDFRR